MSRSTPVGPAVPTIRTRSRVAPHRAAARTGVVLTTTLLALSVVAGIADAQPTHGRTAGAGRGPSTARATSSGSSAARLLVAHDSGRDQGDDTLDTIDPASGAVTAQTPVPGGPDAVAVTPDALTAYVAARSAGTLTPVTVAGAGSAGAATALPAGSAPDAVAITPDGSAAYVVNPSAATLVRVPLTGSAAGTADDPITLPAGSSPDALAITPDGQTALVAAYATGQVLEVSLTSGAVTATVTVGQGPDGIAVTPDGTTALVADGGDGTVDEIALASGAVSSLTLGPSDTPTAVAVSPDGHLAYVTDAGDGTGSTDGTLVRIAVAGLKTFTPVTVGRLPVAVALSADGSTAYVADYASAEISTVSGTTVGTIAVGPRPDALAFTPAQGPTAAFLATAARAGSASSFDASTSHDAAGGPVSSYRWSFGDGTAPVTVDTPTTTHVYAAGGQYTVTLTVTDAAGTSTGTVFTGQTASQVGGPRATATEPLTVPAATVTAGSTLVTMSPHRAYDSRTRHTPIAPGATQRIDVATAVGLPTTGVTAVAVTVTGIGASAPTALTAYPDGAALPATSTLNLARGQTAAQLAELALPADGELDLHSSGGTVDVTLDVSGYYRTGGPSGSGLFVPLAGPSRILDTRADRSTLGPRQTAPITVLGPGGVPTTGVSAVVLNVTAVSPTAATYLQLFPGGAEQPTTSNVNAVRGQTVADRVVVPVGSDGVVDVYNAAGSTDVLLDVTGYFTDGSNPDASGLTYHAVTPQRLLDTRKAGPSIAAGTVRTLSLAGVATMPATGPVSVVATVTGTGPTRATYLSALPHGAALPPTTSDVNVPAGATVANVAVATLSSGEQLDVYNAAGTADAIVDLEGYYS